MKTLVNMDIIMKNIMKNEVYFHYKNKKKSYIVLDFGKIQENDKWVKAIIYKEYNKDKKENILGLFLNFQKNSRKECK